MDTLFIFGAKYLFILSLILGALYFFRAPKETRREIFIFGIFILPLAFLMAKSAGYFYMNPRPFVVGDFTPLIPHVADNGFPSDHTLLVASVAGLFSLFNRRMALSLWIIVLLVGVSRIYVGVHHTVDILASIGIAILSTYVVYVLRHVILKPIKK